jgi:hypothetical protein
MLKLSISFAKKDRTIYKKIQWKMSQNRELAAGNGDGRVFLQSGAIGIFPGAAQSACPGYGFTVVYGPVARTGA